MSNNTESKCLVLADIKVDQGCQARAKTSKSVIDDYAEIIMEQGDDAFPPIVVFYDGTEYWLSDGFHRHAAASKAGLLSVKAEVRPGSQRDAILHAVAANATHGLHRSNADKRHAVAMLLADPEWARWSDGKIADHCGVSDKFVAKQRKHTPNRSESARREYIHPKTGKPTTMNTAKIGKKDDLEELLSIQPDRDEASKQGWLVLPDSPAVGKRTSEETGADLTTDQGSTSAEAQLRDLTAAWSRASAEVRQQFLTNIGVSMRRQDEADPGLTQPAPSPEPLAAASPPEPELAPERETSADHPEQRSPDPGASAIEPPQNNRLFKMWWNYKRLTQKDARRWVEAGCPSEYQDTNLDITNKLASFRAAATSATDEERQEFLQLTQAY